MARYCIIPSEVLPSFNFNSGHPPGSADTMIAKSVRMTLAILFDHILCPSVSFLCSMFSLLWMKARSPHCWEVHLSIGLGHLQYHNIACHSCCHLLSPSQAWVEFCSYVRFSRLTCWVALWQQGEKANVLSTHVLQRTRPNRAGCSMPKIYNQHQQCIPGLIRSSLHFLVWG